MKANAQTGCKCGCKAAQEKGSQLGLDELMIVNPESDGIEGMFLGDDGTLYRVQGMNGEGGLREPGHLFLGDDGALYRAESAGPANAGSATPPSGVADAGNSPEPSSPELGGYLLGEDGTLYEVTE